MNKENLNWFDRFFNRYRKEIIEEGVETWFKLYPSYYSSVVGQKIPNSEYERCFVKYKIIDRLTGSEKIEKEYLN